MDGGDIGALEPIPGKIVVSRQHGVGSLIQKIGRLMKFGYYRQEAPSRSPKLRLGFKLRLPSGRHPHASFIRESD